MKLVWVLLVFFGEVQQEPVSVNDLDSCLKLQQKVLLQNQMQLITKQYNIRAFCVPKRRLKEE